MAPNRDESSDRSLMFYFKMFSEFASDPKVQSMTEAMQRRLVMLFCLHCSGDLEKLSDDELAIAMRINPKELDKTRDTFRRKGFIGDTWVPRNWEKRQAPHDRTAAERMRRLRERQRERDTDVARNVTVDVTRNALRELELEKEEFISFHASTRTREGDDLRDWREAIAELSGSNETKLIGAQLQEHAEVPSIASLEAWRFIHAAHVIQGPEKPKTWDYFVGVARKCNRKQFDAWHTPPPSDAIGRNGTADLADREAPKGRWRNAPQMTPEQRKAVRDSLPDIEKDED